MSKIESWFKKIAAECGCKEIDVERAYRMTRNELMKQGLEPDDPEYNKELMLKTKKKVMKESISTAYEEGVKAGEEWNGYKKVINPYQGEPEEKEWKKGFEKGASLSESNDVKTIVIKKDSSTGEFRVPSFDNKEAGAYYTDDKEDAIDTAKDMYKRAGFDNIDIKFRTVKDFDMYLHKESNIEISLNILTEMIKREADGFNVYSEKGKHMGGPYKTKKEAVERLRQIEYFKHKGK